MKIRWICVALLLPSASISWADSAFQVQGFALPPGYIGFDYPSINESGQVAVTAYNSLFDPLLGDSEGTPFLWNQGQLNALPIAGNAWAVDTAINNAGEVVGYAADSSGNLHPVAWIGGTMNYLPLGGMSSGEAVAINDSNQIAGTIFTTPTSIFDTPTNVQAAVWTGETLNNLGNFGTASANAIAINNHSDILISTAAGSLIYQNGTATPITIRADAMTGATALNEAGQITINDFNAFYIWQNGTSVPIAPLPATMSVGFSSINDSGIIVGTSYIGPNYTEIATLWKDGIPYDLNSLIDPASGWTLTDATEITDDNTIVGIGSDGTDQAIFILTPTSDGGFAVSSVPEPATLSLLAFAAIPLLSRRRKN